MALPSNVGFGKVTGVFLRVTGDGSDTGSDPDGVPLAGLTVTFSASVTRVKNVSADPPVTIIIDTVMCTTDDNGVLVDPLGNEGVWLVASTDPDLDPTGWTWTATIGSGTVDRFSTTFSLDVGQTLDLTTLIPVPSSPGTELAAWQQVVAQITGDVGGFQSLADEAAASASAAAVSAAEAADARDAAQSARTGAENAQSAAASSAATLNTWFLRGTGSPVGVITPSSAGVQYVDLAATNGARVWISTGTTASAWKVVDGDTGWRNVIALINTEAWTCAGVRVRRAGALAMVSILQAQLVSGHSSNEWFIPNHPGFFEDFMNYQGSQLGNFKATNEYIYINPLWGGPQFTKFFSDASLSIPWPTTLPGTPL